MIPIEHDFLFDGMEVGIFRDADFPSSPGRYRYEPYRGPGHYEMQTKLRAGEQPRCYYDRDGFRVSFTVSSCPEHGILELYDFDSSQPMA
jgi:hypothetical protein